MLNIRIQAVKLNQGVRICRCIYYANNGYSTKPAVVKKTEEYENQLKDFKNLTNITKRSRTKDPQKPPFAKNCFLGQFDTDILAYAQLEKEEVDNLEKDSKIVQNLFNQSQFVNTGDFSKFFRQNLADHRLIGLQSPQILNGRECNVTESLKFLEILSKHKLRKNIVNNEQLGIQSLVRFGSDSLQRKYLPRLLSGELTSAFCVKEKALTDLDALQTEAAYVPDSKCWVLNGEKVMVLDGLSADVLVVFATSSITKRDTITQTKMTAFLVEKDFGGVTCTTEDVNNKELYTVNFENTPIPEENVIGELHKGEEVLKVIISEFRLSYGSQCGTLTKELINKLSKAIIEDTNSSFKSDGVTTKIGELSTNMYALESMTYLTAGLIDNYENQDCELESAIVKVFGSETALNTSIACLDLIGPQTANTSHWWKGLHEEACSLLSHDETNTNLKIALALMGLRHAGMNIGERVRKLRNPMFNVLYIWQRKWADRRQHNDDPKLTLNLHYYLHPTCLEMARQLEYCVLRLEFVTEMVLAQHGTEVINKHAQLHRLADIIINIYGMTACISRASRSYCIGLQHAELEIYLAQCFVHTAYNNVKQKINELFHGPMNSNDVRYRHISERLFHTKEYFPNHPLTRNF